MSVDPVTEPIEPIPDLSRLRRFCGSAGIALLVLVLAVAFVSAGAWLGYAYGLGSSAVVVCPVDQR